MGLVLNLAQEEFLLPVSLQNRRPTRLGECFLLCVLCVLVTCKGLFHLFIWSGDSSSKEKIEEMGNLGLMAIYNNEAPCQNEVSNAFAFDELHDAFEDLHVEFKKFFVKYKRLKQVANNLETKANF